MKIKLFQWLRTLFKTVKVVDKLGKTPPSSLVIDYVYVLYPALREIILGCVVFKEVKAIWKYFLSLYLSKLIHQRHSKGEKREQISNNWRKKHYFILNISEIQAKGNNDKLYWELKQLKGKEKFEI